MRDATAILIGGALGYAAFLAFGGFGGGLAAPPRAVLHCAPLVTTVGRPVHCVDLSNRAGARLVGPQGDIPLARGAAAPVFDAPGEATLLLSLPGRPAATAAIAVSPRRPVEPPIGLTLNAPRGAVPSVAHELFETLDPEGPDLQAFERRWPAEPGFVVQRIRLENLTSQGLAGLRFSVVEDGAAASMRFSLRRGDERASLKARIVLEHAPATDGGAFGPTVWLDADGVWRLPAAVDADVVGLIKSDGAPIAQVPVGGTTTLRDGAYLLSVDRAAGGLRLELRANGAPP